MVSDNGLPAGRSAMNTANTGPHAGNIQKNRVPKGARSSTDVQATGRVRAARRNALSGIGQTLAQNEAFQGVGLAGLMALALVFMVLASQFESLIDPLVIIFSVPLGISGVFARLAATETTLSVNGAMGVVMLVGIVASNGVLLVDFANVLRRRGAPLMEATVHAAKPRLRLLLMTTIATVAGLIPMALGIGEGSETNLPLARAVIGGLTVSAFFTLFLIPSLYALADRKKKVPREQDDNGTIADEPAHA